MAPLGRSRYIYIYIYYTYIVFFLSRSPQINPQEVTLSWQAFMKSSLEASGEPCMMLCLMELAKSTGSWPSARKRPREIPKEFALLAIGKLTSFKKTCVQIFNINTMVCKYFSLDHQRKRNTLTKIDVNNLQNMWNTIGTSQKSHVIWPNDNISPT